MRYTGNFIWAIAIMRTKYNEPPEKLAHTAPRGWRRVVPWAVGVLWMVLFLYVAFRRYGRWQLMREYFGPFYPRELEPNVHAVIAALDWRVPLIIAGLPLMVLVVLRSCRAISKRKLPDSAQTSFPVLRNGITKDQESDMHTTQTSSIITARPAWSMSPWPWLFVGAMSGLYRMGPEGWSDIPLAITEQLRLIACVLFVSLGIETRRSWQNKVLLGVLGLVAFGFVQRSFGYYPVLIVLITFVLALSGRRWSAIIFLVAATIALVAVISGSPYRIDQLATMTLDWWDASRDGHANYDVMQQHIRRGGWFGAAEHDVAAMLVGGQTSAVTWVSWNLSKYCLVHGSAALLAWIGFVGAWFVWVTRRLRHVAENGLRTALFAISTLLVWLAIQPVLEVNGFVPHWLAAHPMSATTCVLVLLAIGLIAANSKLDRMPTGLPASWRLIRNMAIGLVGFVLAAHVRLILLGYAMV